MASVNGVQACKAEIEKAKLALLDLSKRNPLISYKHTKSRGYARCLRAVNTTLNGLFATLDRGDRLSFASLPPPPEETEEDVEDGVVELSPDRGTIPPSLSLATLEDDPSEAQPLSRNDYARTLGINPSYDLMAGDTSVPQKIGQDEVFQTLLYPDELKAHLEKIAADEKRYRQEKGVNTLFIAFGFLEWREADYSEVTLLSPLLLYPVRLDNVKEGGVTSCYLRGGEGELLPNTALSKRLKRDFGLELPPYEEGGSLEGYLELVETSFRKLHPTWSVRSFITLGMFPFARLAMYQDLEGGQWPQPIEESPLLQHVLAGQEDENGGAIQEERSYDIDSDEVLREAPYLFLDADSSQHGAILDTLSGDSLVIQGPPGTGKSQTITNIIATMLAKGKRILFVAEKQAALQVVSKRLDQIGLGTFCLDLHSDNNNQKQVFRNLKERIDLMSEPGIKLKSDSATEAYDREIVRLQNTRQRLNKYQDLMATRVGAGGNTIHDLIWRYNRHTLDTEPAIEGGRVNYLPDAEKLSGEAYNHYREELALFANYIQEICRFGAPQEHPWFGVNNDHVASTDINDIQSELEQLLKLLGLWKSYQQQLNLDGLDETCPLGEVEDVLKKLLQIAWPQAMSQEVYERLSQEPYRECFLDWYDSVKQYRKHLEEQKVYFSPPADVSLRYLQKALGGVAPILLAFPETMRLSDLHASVQTRFAAQKLLKQLSDVVLGLNERLRSGVPQDWAELAKIIQNAAKNLAFVEVIRDGLSVLEESGLKLGQDDLLALRKAFSPLLPYLKLLPEGLTIGTMGHWEQNQKDFTAQLDDYHEHVKKLAHILHVSEPETVVSIKIFDKAADLLTAQPPGIREALTPMLCSTDGGTLLQKMNAELARIKEETQKLSPDYNLDLSPQSSTLRQAAITVREAGALGFLNKETRQAQKLYKRLRKEKSKSSNQTKSEELEMLADYFEQCQSFTDNPLYKELCGPYFKGLKTDVALFSQAIHWIAQVRDALKPYGTLGLQLQQTLLGANAAEAEAYQAHLQNRPPPPQDFNPDYDKGFDAYQQDVEGSVRHVKQMVANISPFCASPSFSLHTCRTIDNYLNQLAQGSEENQLTLPQPLTFSALEVWASKIESVYKPLKDALDAFPQLFTGLSPLEWEKASTTKEVVSGWLKSLLVHLYPLLQPEKKMWDVADVPPLFLFDQEKKAYKNLPDTLLKVNQQLSQILTLLSKAHFSEGMSLAQLLASLDNLGQLAQEQQNSAVPPKLEKLQNVIKLSPKMDIAPLEPFATLFRCVRDLQFPRSVQEGIFRCSPHSLQEAKKTVVKAWLDVIHKFKDDLQNFVQGLSINIADFFKGGARIEDVPLHHYWSVLARAQENVADLPEWSRYRQKREALMTTQLRPVFQLWERCHGKMPLTQLFDYAYCRSMMRYVEHEYKDLMEQSGERHQNLIDQFRSLDEQVRSLNERCLVLKLLQNDPPKGCSTPPVRNLTEFSLLKHEAEKKGRHVPLRDLLYRAGKAIQSLKPCFMMSPISVANYLRPGELSFDLLVIDEASQMEPSEALGALARCSQAVIVGDDMQLPPSRGFQASNVPTEEEEQSTADLESILSLCQASFSHRRTLRFHYRSRHSSLINFSNHRFYRDSLLIPVSPYENEPRYGVHRVDVHGLYGGMRRGNLDEVQAICDEAVRHMKTHAEYSLGLVTMNTTQRDFIQDEMNKRAAQDETVRRYIARWGEQIESFFVKSLEHVQGDERDVMLVSTVFGPAEPGGPVRQNFGPINQASGFRRLNVLFTRAKYRLVLFTSMDASQVQAESGKLTGPSVLRDYITYAKDRRVEYGEKTERQPDSPFEELVIEKLREHGYDVDPQVGVKGFYIDIGLRDPDHPARYLMGIECDGASYHSARSARDRDILREQILVAQGWTIYRIWSTDWYGNMQRELDRLLDCIERHRERKTA